MRFLYMLERFEGEEYVVVIVEEGEHRGIGAVIPSRFKGENYKTVMGAIEEYRYVVERSKPEHFAVISKRLERHFPGHPETRFAISAAFFELFAKLNGMKVRELIIPDFESFPVTSAPGGRCDDVVIPEGEGGVLEAILRSGEAECVLKRKYPRGEMEEVLDAISTYFNGVIEYGEREEG